MKKWTLSLMLILGSLVLFLNTNYQTIKAVQTQTPLSTVLSNTTDRYDVDRKIPNGLTDISKWFTVPDVQVSGKNNNDAVVYPANGTVNKGNSDVVMLTKYNSALNAPGTVGAIWSKQDNSDETNRNYIDITKRQTMSMWMYFGGAAKSNNQVNPGDGMAFVLQNSAQKDAAFTKIPYTDNVGEALGVWGETNNKSDTPALLASRAIQNSWAIEFDTYLNNPKTSEAGYAADSIFDSDFQINNHIATGYPARESTYTGTVNGITMNHGDVFSANLINDAWHHITITWNPATDGSTNAKVTLDYNDKNIDGDKLVGTSKTYTVDTSAFNLPANDNKVYWGFTGSTGSSSENNLVIFESIPSIVEADATSSLIDETSGNRVISDATTDNPNANVVYNGDAVNVNYDLKYLSGSQSWKDISADIKLPEKIDYNSAVITYTDTDGNKTTEAVDELKNMTNNEIVHKLAQSLGKTGITSANIKFEGTVNAGTTATSTTVAAVNSSFDGSNLQKDVMSQAFVIKQPNKITLTKTSNDPISLNMGENVNLNGKIAYSDTSTTIDPTKFSVVATVNGTEISKTTMSTILAGSSKDAFALPVSTSLYSSLKEGSNTVDIYVYNTSDYNASNHISYTVNVSGTVKVVANSTSHFNPVQSYSTKSIVSRADDWSVDVIDSREKGATWKLSASSTPLTDGDKNFTDNTSDSGIVFVDNTGKATNITDNLTRIDSGTKDQTSSETFDIDKDWTEQTGILLKRDAYVQQGTYAATITWTLGDSI